MIEIEAKGLQRLRRTLQGLQQDSHRSMVMAVNYAARRGRTEGGREIRRQVNLKAPYVNENLKVSRQAKQSDPEPYAVISGRVRPVRLARYGARQLTQRGPYARGDLLRGIKSGRKQAGVSVKVKPGGRPRKMRKAFLVPLKRGKMPGDKTNMGVFIRTGKDKNAIRHLYGPSVDQVFSRIRSELSPAIRQDLASEYSRLLRAKVAQRARTQN